MAFEAILDEVDQLHNSALVLENRGQALTFSSHIFVPIFSGIPGPNLYGQLYL